MLGQFNATQKGSLMMATHGAVPSGKTSTPAAIPIAWSVFLKEAPTVRTRVETQHWKRACEEGAPMLGALVEAVDAEPAVEA